MALRGYWTRLARTIDDYLTLRPHLDLPSPRGSTAFHTTGRTASPPAVEICCMPNSPDAYHYGHQLGGAVMALASPPCLPIQQDLCDLQFIV